MKKEIKEIDWSKWDSKEDCFAKYSHAPSVLIYGVLPSKKPDVSIMIPTYRRADLLKEAIKSLKKVLQIILASRIFDILPKTLRFLCSSRI